MVFYNRLFDEETRLYNSFKVEANRDQQVNSFQFLQIVNTW